MVPAALIAACIIALLLWTKHVHRIMQQRREMVAQSARQRDKYRRKARRGRNGEVLSRSEHIYRQSLELYHQGLRTPYYRPFAALLGFHPIEDDAAPTQKKANPITVDGGTKRMQKTVNMDNIRLAMYEMFGIGNGPQQEEALLDEPVQDDLPAEEVIAPAEELPASVPTAETPAPAPKAVSYLAEGCVWEGSLRSEGDVEIACLFRGDISAGGCVTLHSIMEGNVRADTLTLRGCSLTGDVTCEGTVLIDCDSSICGNVTAKEVRCAGRLKGDMQASDAVILESSATVDGNIKAGSICVAQGAVIRGGVDSHTH